MTSPSAPRLRVLVVDDEPSILDAFCRVFRRDLQVEVAHNGAQALELLGASVFDFVFADYKMAGMNGVALLLQAARLHPTTIRVLMTAHFNLDEVLDAVRDGIAAHLIHKPWVRADVMAVIDGTRAARGATA